MNVEDNKVVSIHYTLTNPEGETIDSSVGGEPLAYLHGASNIIPGLENALAGKAVGEKLTVTVPPEEGYGESHPEMIQTVPREAFQGVDEIQPGMRFEAESAQGPISVVVTAVTDTEVTVDGNHPLAGVTLTFDVEITDVRDATAEELEHGHVHGPEGHH
ncbi:peptidylprolyl isomerase [Thiohalobacter sp. IOR34]|uniref:FKBP-type peptidyl-prolyl cis-trans isomerase n=1 Tax=Thiohalobacter sp. IOR34 TaxID=3057176 RepID=UPI0025B027CD|nr:peptidylprolyl isomerase [Thiohalobacter sp. IOR34]WJW75502.1 peptidylprolyl isomerase [Thiohalobacter sp. IOR34]